MVSKDILDDIHKAIMQQKTVLCNKMVQKKVPPLKIEGQGC